MAPTRQKVKNTKVSGKDVHFNKAKLPTAAVKKKRKWIPEHKFKGSVKEGRGFAFDKKQKVRHEYNKLLRKERKKQTTESKVLYKEEYPEHLKHLYLAEEEKLRNEAWTNRMNRSKLRIKGQLKDKQSAAVDDDDEEEEEEFIGGSEQMDSVSENPKPMMALEKESLPISNRMKKKMEKKTSYQRTKEEFERVRENQRKKKEEYLKNKQQREEALQRYKQKKSETFQMLSKKTKKGQPNLNLQMEYLLQKIQGANK
ncbi:thyroid transcription factor 1-associated protein 26 homolog [Nothobranchius furzeri]|uniref:Coiled-coil domain containing 59 n=2 Tax=Nothobranchius furzeri TaxID=105023 RepID=A0A8C6KI69_NOTFU|nr:coiled-coil domain containing 59 [Nothobranchius furzeri]